MCMTRFHLGKQVHDLISASAQYYGAKDNQPWLRRVTIGVVVSIVTWVHVIRNSSAASVFYERLSSHVADNLHDVSY